MIATGLIVLLIFFPGVFTAMLTAHRLLRLRRSLISICPRCLYPLHDLVGGRCAECGNVIPDGRDLGGVRNVSDALSGRELVLAVGSAMIIVFVLLTLRSVNFAGFGLFVGVTMLWTVTPVLGAICMPMPKALARRLVWRIWQAYVAAAAITFAVVSAAHLGEEDAAMLTLLVSACAALWTFSIVGSGIRQAVIGGRRPIPR